MEPYIFKVDHSGKIIREDNNGVPVDRKKDGRKTRLVYISKPDYSSLCQEKN